MNRETLDGIVKQGLIKYADDLLIQIGREFSVSDFHEFRNCASWTAAWIKEREEVLALLHDDVRRLNRVDKALEEMK